MIMKESDSGLAALFVAESRGEEDNNFNLLERSSPPRVSSWEGYGLMNRR
jgi:hypothetical protein